MNALLLIAVLVLVGGGNGAFNPSCLKNSDNNPYRNFVCKHVLQEEINPSKIDGWQKYLKKYNLCGRPVQSFVDKGAENLYVNICNGFGKRRGKSNLCTSTSKVHLYDLNVNTGDCSVASLKEEDKYVTVACVKVANKYYRPVHFQDSLYNEPDAGEICKPRK